MVYDLNKKRREKGGGEKYGKQQTALSRTYWKDGWWRLTNSCTFPGIYQPRSIIWDLSPKYFIYNEVKLYFMLVTTPSCSQCVFRSYHYNANLRYDTCKINKSIEKLTNGRCVRRTQKNQNCLNENINSTLNSVSPNIRSANLCFSFCHLQKCKNLNTCKNCYFTFLYARVWELVSGLRVDIHFRMFEKWDIQMSVGSWQGLACCTSSFSPFLALESGHSWPLKIVPASCPEMQVRNYHYTLHNNPEERSSHLLLGENLKSRVYNEVSNSCITRS